jgi:hypothetical protein
MRLNLMTLAAGITMVTIMGCTVQAQEASQAHIEQISALIQADAGKAKLFLQSLLQSRSDSKTILDCSVFVPKR